MSNLLIIKIVTIFMLLFILYILFIVEPSKKPPLYHYQDIKRRLQTGDIILFSCKRHPSFFGKILYASRTNLLDSEYGHAGMVIKGRNNIYVLECCKAEHPGFTSAKYLNDKGKGGVRIIEFDRLLKEYHDFYDGIFAIKFISSAISNSMLMKNLKKYQDVTFQETSVLLTLVVFDIFISPRLAEEVAKMCPCNKMVCTEFLHAILYDCHVLKKYSSKLFWPHKITNKIFDKIKLINYSHPYQFKIDF